MEDTERLVVLLEARVRDFEKNLQKASGTAGREYDRMRRGSQSATKQMEQDMVRSTNRINQALATVSAGASKFAAPIAAGVAAAGVAVAGFAVQARQVARDIATIGDEAKRAGINVKGFQELKFVADQNRISIDALTDGIKEMNLRADEFIVTGSGSGAEAFKRLGFTAADLAKKLKDPSALFTEIIGKLEKMDRAAQIRIMDEVFGGTGGEQFVQLLEQGEAGLRRTIDEANRLGIVMDEQMIAKAAEVDRQFGALATTVETKLKGAIVNAASALADFMERFRGFENQRDATLNTELAEIGKRRMENEARIAELRSGATIFNRGRSESAAALLEEENAALAEQERQILDVLKARGAFSTSSKEMEEGLRKVGHANQAVGDSLEYVTRNGGAAAATVDQYGKSISDLRARLSDTVAGARLTVDTFGQTEGAIAAARFEADAMADALRAANAAGKEGVDPNLASFIREQAAEYGRLTDQIAASTKAEQERQRIADQARERRSAIAAFEDDIAFERSILSLPAAEQQIRTTLRGLDVEYDSFEGQRIAAGLRYNDQLADMQDRMRETGEIGRDAFLDVFDALTQGGDVVDNLIRAFANLGRQMASAGAQKLFDTLFGGGGGKPAASGLMSALGQIPANQNIPIPTARPEYQAATMAATKMTNASSSLADVIRDGAARIGTTARDLAAVISFETGGTFSTSIRGGAGNRHIGLIQFGAAEQKRYGAAIGQTLSDQMDAVVSYMKDRGFKPGMGLLDLYSTVNAGRPGRYNASDARNGGTWGTVADKVNSQFAPHLAKADSVLNSTTRDFTKGVSKGVEDGFQRVANDNWAGMREGDVVSQPGMSRGQAGLGLLGAAAGIFGAGYQSGSPLSGGISGALGGFQASGAIASAFPALAGVAGPLGAGLGAITGCVGGDFGKPERIAA